MAAGKPLVTYILRVLALLSYFVAALVMFLNTQKVGHEPFNFIARYNDWNGLAFFAVITCVGSVYNFIILVIPPGTPLWKTVIALDVILNLVVATSLGTGWQTYTVMKSGSSKMGWLGICDVVPIFCRKAVGSLSTGTLGFIISIALLMSTLHVSVDPLLVAHLQST